MPISAVEIVPQAERLSESSPQEILAFAIEAYSPNIAVSFSGAEDVVLIDMAVKLNERIRVFTLDTGRLHAETYQFLNRYANVTKLILRYSFRVLMP